MILVHQNDKTLLGSAAADDVVAACMGRPLLYKGRTKLELNNCYPIVLSLFSHSELVIPLLQSQCINSKLRVSPACLSGCVLSTNYFMGMLWEAYGSCGQELPT